MLPLYLILAVMLATSPGAYAQDAAEQPQGLIEQPAAEAPIRQAIPRAGAPRVERSTRAEASGSAEDQRRAVPRGGRPQGDNPRTGTAVPRAARPAPTTAPVDRGRAADGRRTVIVRPPAVYNNYYNYRRRSYPYGYGAFGLGYSYYDPYRWYPGAYSYSPYWGSGYYGLQSSSFDIGELRLQVSPRHAQVFVDGYYAGTVDDYDGAFQSLKLESGPYAIQIVAPGYDTLDFDVRINPGQKITYREDLRPRP